MDETSRPDVTPPRAGGAPAGNPHTTGPVGTHDDVTHSQPRGRILNIAVSAIAALISLLFIAWMVTNERFQWDVVGSYLFHPSVLKGVGMTLVLTALCMGLGAIFGTILALMKLSEVTGLRHISTGFVWAFRSVPMLVQLIFWFNLSYLLPRIVVGIPFGPEFFSWDTNDLINAFTAAVIGLTIHEAVYMAEIVRSGLLSVDSGQRDAAKALGYSPNQILSKIILPQASRVIIPPTGSQVISLLKGTSLVSAIGMTELLHSVQVIYSRTFEVVPLLLVATIWYLLLVGILSFLQGKLETSMSRGYARTVSTTKPTKFKPKLPGKVE